MLKKKQIYIEKLSSEQRAKLKSLAHHLKPVVQIGNQGFTQTVVQEIALALEKHELIKVQLPSATDAQTKETEQTQLLGLLPKHVHLVSRIGRTVILYFEKKDADKKVKI